MASKDLGYGRRIASHAAALGHSNLPDKIRLKTKIHIIDTLAAIVSGTALEAGIAGQKFALSTGTRPVAAIVGTTHKVGLIEAALANGMAAHADESDDSHETSQTHPGCAVLPAAISVGQAREATGLAFLNAVHLGYDLTIRFGEALSPAMSFARSSLSCHAFAPIFGAGFAAGSLMGFDAERFLVVLNYLAQEASGLTTWRRDGAHTLKSYVFAGMPASNAVKAAGLVESGFTGSGDVLDPSDRNFFEAISSRAEPNRLYVDLGTSYKVLETDIKKYSVGFPIAAPLSVLEDILGRAGLRHDEIKAIRIRYHPDWYKVIGDENRMPDLNLRHCMAAMVVEGMLSFDASHDVGRMSDACTLSVGRRITLLPNEEGQDRFEARIEVDARGQTYRSAQGLYVLGRKENPMTTEQVHDKAVELLTTVISEPAARRAIDIVHAIEHEKDLSRLIAALTPERRR
ncbi:MmgE/PrpD family protein [Shumkonia mesophila]|uniref:MmgE/PrpD family protein n=1 Tax=Shumkonia mesophila TaxID=2838854 RepID=UPI002934D139|nr:MmgE/PrpD family protein [Shumkonia mesophila]